MTAQLAAVAQNRNPEAIKFAIVQMALAGNSYTVIAKEMDTTKGIVAGVVYRAKKALDRRSPAPRTPPAPKRPAKFAAYGGETDAAKVDVIAKQRMAEREQGSTQPTTVWQPKPVAYFNIRDGLCRWPLWNAKTPFSEKFFCGLPTEGETYCPHCTARGTSPKATKWMDGKLGVDKARAAA